MRTKRNDNHSWKLSFFPYTKRGKENKSKYSYLLKFLPLFSLLISLLSIYVAYKSLRLVAIEKGADVNPKVVSSLKQTSNLKSFVVSIQNVSNTPIGINSAYILVYEINNDNSISFEKILNNQLISLTRLLPFEKQSDTIKRVIDSGLYGIRENGITKTVLELRIYYSRLFDGKIFGVKSFYTVSGMTADLDLFENEKDLHNHLEFLKNHQSITSLLPEHEEYKEFNLKRIELFNKLKSPSFLKDSLNMVKGLIEYPTLEEPYLSPNYQYHIQVKEN